METIKVRKQEHKHIYVHNDLSNAAYHFKTAIESKVAANDRNGIAFDYMACLLMLAFTFGAKMNFLGSKLFADKWQERHSFREKNKQILAKLKIVPDWTVRPFSSIDAMKNFRDSIAHGKPVEIVTDETVITTSEAANKRIDLDSEWHRYCEHDPVFNSFEDVETIWKQLLQAAKLEVLDTVSHGSSTVSFIEKIVDVPETKDAAS
jgi:hypothetical protein